MMYVSIDIETTGLNHGKDQVLEFAAVLWDKEDVMECSWFRRRIYWERLSGSPYALWLNRKYIEALKDVVCKGGKLYVNDEVSSLWVWPKDLGRQFAEWMDKQGIKKVFPLGKNVAAFDMDYLGRLGGWPKELFKYRALDVGTLAATRLSIPSLFDIKINEDVLLRLEGKQHEALYDARYALQVAMERLGTGDKAR
jgi:oligoribonuclease (3'-5' exoribonuclease)